MNAGAWAILANMPENGVTTQQLWENVDVRAHFDARLSVQRACEKLEGAGELFWDKINLLWFPT